VTPNSGSDLPGNATNRRIITRYAQMWGMRPRDAATAREALAWIERGDPFDVAMPEMDGVELGREIRRHRDAEALPILFFSSLGRREPGSDELDVAAWLATPLRASQLFDTFTSIFAVAVSAPSSRQTRSDSEWLDGRLAEQLPLRVLLAEDNAVNQKLAVRLLGRMGYHADVVGNGLEAIEALERQPYDVVLMDVQMPEMDGLETTRRICASWPQTHRPRIIAMTANAMQGDREAYLAAGMDDYVVKPIRVEELARALRESRPLENAGGAIDG
jgi:CheY-like chemotaxis protein